MNYYLNEDGVLYAFEETDPDHYHAGMAQITEAEALEIQNSVRPLTESEARAYRNSLLSACDWTMLPDANVANVSEWQTYRQALRDVPEQAGFPAVIEWPVAPAGIL